LDSANCKTKQRRHRLGSMSKILRSKRDVIASIWRLPRSRGEFSAWKRAKKYQKKKKNIGVRIEVSHTSGAANA